MREILMLNPMIAENFYSSKFFKILLVLSFFVISNMNVLAKSSLKQEDYTADTTCSGLFLVMSATAEKNGEKKLSDALLQAASILFINTSNEFKNITKKENMKAVSIMFDVILGLSAKEYDDFVSEWYVFCIDRLR